MALRSFVEDGHQTLCQSYAKNLAHGSASARSARSAPPPKKAALESQLKAIIRPMYSSPPIHGARIVDGLGDVRAQWTGECEKWPHQDMRALLKRARGGGIHKRLEPHHDQIGMFAIRD